MTVGLQKQYMMTFLKNYDEEELKQLGELLDEHVDGMGEMQRKGDAG